MESDLVMSSTTDTPEEIRAGLGLPVEESAEPVTEEAPVTEEVPVTEEAAPVTEPPAEEKPVTAAPVAGKKPKVITAAQKELDKVAARARRDSEARAAVLAAENKALRDRLAMSAVPADKIATDPEVSKTFEARKASLGPKPKQTDFEDYDEFEAKRDDWIAEQASIRTEERLAHQGAATRADLAREQATRDGEAIVQTFEASKRTAHARHADYDEVMDRAQKAGLPISAHVRDAVLEMGEDSGEVAYHLAADHALLTRLNGLRPVAVAIELGRLIQRVSDPAAVAAQPPAARPRTKAPTPLGSEMGAAPSAVADELENAPDQRTYNKIRDRQQKARGRR